MFDTDDEDFTLSPSSKLASIFGLSTGSEDSNTSLTYKAPKQPKPTSNNAVDLNQTVMKNKLDEGQTQPLSSVIFAKVITLWKADNGKNKLMGKYMVALTSNPIKSVTELMIYQDKTKILIRETLDKSLIFVKYQNNFIAFCDSQKKLWNLSFDTVENKEIFLQHIENCHCILQEQNNNGNKDETDDTNPTQVSTKPEISSDIKSSDATKEQILSRVTKMGQPILPRMVELHKSSEVSDYESESSCTETVKPVTVPRKLRKTPGSTEKALTVAPIVPEVNNRTYSMPFANNNYYVPQNQMMHAQNPTGLVYSQSMPDYGLSHFLINQNAELKASLAEINAKLNNAFISSDKNGNSCEETSVLKSKIKCQSLKIDNLNSELQKMHKKFQDLSIKYEDKCKELMEAKATKEQSGLLESELIFLRDKVKQADILQERLEKLENDVKIKDDKMNLLNVDLNSIEQQLLEAKTQNEILLTKNSELNERLQQTLLELDEQRKQTCVNEGENNMNPLNKEKVSKIIKDSMNEAFRGIMGSFSDDKSYETREIQAVLMQNLLDTSFKLINSFL
ncbi:uncharacterized protein LOC126733880 [Anthonomus grandis grandis]|uniref:uncharacterized protein LOC126733880 n=1 Tax=Anthonomus grandis grandis TaxID=2921223 RepID=UPI0021657EBE|nr:uncharacterized protein LOC126733880 [Anthonomus grandis grandis]